MLRKMAEQAVAIAIGGHVRPDGDCTGSCLGTYLYLREQFPDKQIDVYLESIPEPFLFLKGSDHISHEIPENKEYDLFITLDCGDLRRLGFSAPLFEKAKHTFCIDHHVSNQAFAEQNYIYPEASSTSELVFELIKEEAISKEVAECLYLGMVHDTGLFRYSCTHPSTMRAAARLMETGIDFTRIVTETFDEKTYAQNQITGYALLNSKLYLEGRVIVSVITLADMERFGVSYKQLDGIVSQLKMTKGIDTAIFMYEQGDGQYKVSLRSTEAVNVSLIASRFGGGGHERAAGVGMKGTVAEILEQLIPAIENQL